MFVMSGYVEIDVCAGQKFPNMFELPIAMYMLYFKAVYVVYL